MKYYSDWKNISADCPYCKWTGIGIETKQGELYSTFVERICPKCGENVFLLEFPTLEETEKNWYNVSEEDRKVHDIITDGRRERDRYALKSISQLPEIDSESFTLSWDTEHNEWSNNFYIIKHGEQLIWRQPALFEDYKTFYKVAEICKKKYGSRLKDIIQTKRSEYSMYGDQILWGTIERYRKDLFDI
jgi:predicted RNA-binding Zn-ribbon protein involved in translation (DUF1610 family)